MPREYVIYYLIYGFVFVAMGLFALQYRNDEQISNTALAGALPDLGLFGVIHGITELMTMIRATQLYPELDSALFLIGSFLKVLSFGFLMRFGIKMKWQYM